MGHLEAAAGMAGFIKAVLALQRGQIPPNLHFSRSGIRRSTRHRRGCSCPTEMAPWPESDGPRRAGVSSFGIGGTNAHVVLEQGPGSGAGGRRAAEPGGDDAGGLGQDAERVASTAAALADWMDGDGAAVPLADVAHTLNHHRARHAKFATVCARDRAQAVAGLRALAAGQPAPGVVAPHRGPTRPGTVFVYSGSGLAVGRDGPAVAGR